MRRPRKEAPTSGEDGMTLQGQRCVPQSLQWNALPPIGGECRGQVCVPPGGARGGEARSLRNPTTAVPAVHGPGRVCSSAGFWLGVWDERRKNLGQGGAHVERQARLGSSERN